MKEWLSVNEPPSKNMPVVMTGSKQLYVVEGEYRDGKWFNNQGVESYPVFWKPVKVEEVDYDLAEVPQENNLEVEHGNKKRKQTKSESPLV